MQEKRGLWIKNGNNSRRAVTAAVTGKQSTVDILSVLIHRGVIDFKSKICLKKFSETGTVKKKQLIYTR